MDQLIKWFLAAALISIAVILSAAALGSVYWLLWIVGVV